MITFYTTNSYASNQIINIGNGSVSLDIPDTFQISTSNQTNQINSQFIKTWRDPSTHIIFSIMIIKPPIAFQLPTVASDITKSIISALEGMDTMTQLMEFTRFNWGIDNSTSGFKSMILEYNFEYKETFRESLIKSVVLFTEQDGTYYILTFKIPFKNFDQAMKDIQPVINSFGILE